MKQYPILLLVTYQTPADLSTESVQTAAVNAFLQSKLSGMWSVDEKGGMKKIPDEDYYPPIKILILEFSGGKTILEAGQFRFHCELAKENHPAVGIFESIVTLPLTEFATGETKLLDIGATKNMGEIEVTYTLRNE